MSNIFLCGGNCSVNNFENKLNFEFTEYLEKMYSQSKGVKYKQENGNYLKFNNFNSSNREFALLEGII